MNRYRVAIGSLFIECNQLGGVPAGIDCFERCELWRDDQVLTHSTGAVAGMFDVLRGRSVQVEPLIVATACPSGPLTVACYAQLKSELLARLRAAMPVDGLMLALHGAAAAENVDDIEGDLLTVVREIVGTELPVVVTLDLHAHVTSAMVRHADALIAWETYPHRDAEETGRRGARLLLKMLDHECRPTMAMAKVPVLVGSVHGNTAGAGPFADIMRRAKSYEKQPGVLSTSVFAVYPYLDLPDLGVGGLVITDNDLPRAEALARDLANMYWGKRFDLEPEVYAPMEAIRRGMSIDGGPVLLVETADCCGGGAAGDSVATLRALLANDRSISSLVPVVDPAIAAVCHEHPVGNEITVSLGHNLDPRWGQPMRLTGQVTMLGDGRFRYAGGIWAGQLAEMGMSAVLRVGEIEILVTSNATYEWADEQFRAMEMVAEKAKFVVVKNPMNYRVGYGQLAKAAFILDTPGPTPATLRNVQFQRVRRPYFPADEQIGDLEPVVLRGN